MGEAARQLSDHTDSEPSARILQLSFVDALDAADDASAEDWRIVGRDEDCIEAPKAAAHHAPDWARVGLVGFEAWLCFYGIDGKRDPQVYPAVDEEYTPDYEPAAETLALDNLEADAERWRSAAHSLDITLRHKQLIALERYFLKQHERKEFRVKYSDFIRHRLGNISPSSTHRYDWMADRLGVDDVRAVIDELETVSARLELLDGMGIEPIMNVPIADLLNAKRSYARVAGASAKAA